MIDNYSKGQLEKILAALNDGPKGPIENKTLVWVSAESGKLVSSLNGQGTDEELEYATKEIHKRCLAYEARLRGDIRWGWPEEYKGDDGADVIKAEIIMFVEGWLETIGQAAS